MQDWPQIRALCRQLRISEIVALNTLQSEARSAVSDNCVTIEDIADADVPAALAFIKSRFGPDQPEML